MASVQLRKNEMAQLWGLEPASIESKLAELRMILGSNIADGILLDYLNKSDLDIAVAVNRHFSGLTPTPPPEQQEQPQTEANKSTSCDSDIAILPNNNNKSSEIDWSNLSAIDGAKLFDDDDDDDDMTHLKNKLSEHMIENYEEDDDDEDEGEIDKRISLKRKKRKRSEFEENYISMTNNNNSNKNLNPSKKRKMLEINNNNNNNKNNKAQSIEFEFKNSDNNEFNIEASPSVDIIIDNQSDKENKDSSNQKKKSNNSKAEMDTDDEDDDGVNNNNNNNNNNDENEVKQIEDLIDVDHHKNMLNLKDNNWTNKKLKNLCFDYKELSKVHRHYNARHPINKLHSTLSREEAEINKNKLNYQYENNKDKINELYIKCIGELNGNYSEKTVSGIRIKMKHKTEIKDEEKEIDEKEKEEKLNNEFLEFAEKTYGGFKFLDDDSNTFDVLYGVFKQNKEKNANLNVLKKYNMEFEIDLVRKLRVGGIWATIAKKNNKKNNNAKGQTAFPTEMPYTMALLGGTKQLFNLTISSLNVVQEFDNKKLTYSLPGLLDLAIRDKYIVKRNELNNNNNNNNNNEEEEAGEGDINMNDNENNENNEDINDEFIDPLYGLNISLFDYQYQTIHYMVNEETHPIGFYRHFYKKGSFSKNGGDFYYSPIFNELLVNESLPVVHGGFLCEEMGLGKTIESLAIIYRNKCLEGTYSTKKSLKLSFIKNVPDSVRYKANPNYEPLLGRKSKKELPYTVNEDWKVYKSKCTLIIGPVSLIGQWENEIDKRMANGNQSISYKRYYGQRSRNIKDYMNYDVIFTTYGILGAELGNIKTKHILHQIEFHRIILDESHYIKNGFTKTSKSINKLHAVNRWCLTGTPFGRVLSDLENQLSFLGLQKAHLSKLCLKELSKANVFGGAATRGAGFYQSKMIPLLNVVKSMVMRHRKNQKFNDKPIVQLPEKNEDVIFVEFTEQQRTYYDKLFAIAKERYDYYKASGNIGRGTLAILGSLHPARAACSGYVCSAEDIEKQLSTAQALRYKVEQIIRDYGTTSMSRSELFQMAAEEAYNYDETECSICWESPLENPLQTPCRHLFCGECIQNYVMNSKPECPMCRAKVTAKDLKQPPKPGGNDNDNETDKKEKENEKKKDDLPLPNGTDEIRFDSKIKELIKRLKALQVDKPNDKSLIFTAFGKSLDWLCKELDGANIGYKTLTGSMTMNKRAKSLKEFSNDPSVKVFILTIRSGAVGLTLTAANHIFLMEPPFNPALYKQAINRVYRLGQDKKVSIYTMIMKNSIEERIWNLNKDKFRDSLGEDNDNNNEENKNKNKNLNLAGNIISDRTTKMEVSDISKLFQEDTENQNEAPEGNNNNNNNNSNNNNN